jgi:parallel beta-helix repeat protein
MQQSKSPAGNHEVQGPIRAHDLHRTIDGRPRKGRSVSGARWRAVTAAIGLGVISALLLVLVPTRDVAQAAPPENPTPFLVTRSGSTYTAASQTTSTIYTGSLKSVVESAVQDLNGFTSGGVIRFASDDFDLGSDFFVLHDVHDIVFQGQGIDQTVIHNVNDGALDTEPFNFSTATTITIEDMTIAAGGIPRTTSDAIDFDNGSHSVVDRVKITASRARGIIFDGKGDAGQGAWAADFNVVRNCVISDPPGSGIEFLGSNNNEVSGCTIQNAGDNGIKVNKASPLAFTANKKSNDNYIHGNTIDNAAVNGIGINSSDGNQIADNTITNSGNAVAADGIRIASNDSIPCDGNSVSGNTATDNQTPKTQRYGLNISSSLCSNNVVGANSFDGNAKDPIQDLGTNTQYLVDTVPLYDGFESGDLSRWTASSGLTVQQGTVSAGSWAAEGLTTGSGGASAAKQLSPSKTDLYYAVRFKVGSRAASTPINLLRFRNNSTGANPIATLAVTATARIQLRNDVTGVTTLSSTVAADGSWHQAQVHVVVNGTSSQSQVWVDGNSVPELALNGINLGTAPIGRVELGDPSTTKTYDVFYDEASVSGSFITDADTTPPSPPSGLTASAVSGTQVDLSWTASTDDVAVDHYLILRDGTKIADTPGPTTSFSDTTVTDGSTHTYQVEASDAAGNISAPSASATATTPDVTAPTAPTALTATAASTTRVDLSWTASTDNVAVDHYLILRDGTKIADTSGPTTSFSDTTVVTTTTYTYRVEAVDAAGNSSAPSDAATVTTLDGTPPTAPTGLTVAGRSAGEVDLAWNASTDNVGVTGYSVFRNNVNLGDVTTTSFADTTVLQGVSYTYTVKASDAAGNTSAASSAITVVPDWTPPSAPTGLKTTKIMKNRIDLAWNAATDNVKVTAYRVFRGSVQIAEVSSLSYNDKTAPSGSTVTYTVKAVDAAGNVSAASNSITVRAP